MRRSVVILLLAVLVPGSPARAQGQTPVVGPPSISGATVARIVAGTPLAAYATEISRLGAEARVDPAFALAVWQHESQFGTTGAAVPNHNPGNLICAAAGHPSASGCAGRWAVYPSWADAISDWYGYINCRYLTRGSTTVEAILSAYAPPSENDTAGYITAVETLMRQWGSGIVGTVPDSQGSGASAGGGFMDDWVYKPLDQLVYNAERLLASVIWGLNQSGLWLDDLIERFRLALVTGGFRPAIDAVAGGLLGISRPVFELGLVLAFFLMLLQPIIRFQFVNLRKLVVLAVVLPILLPATGAIFQDLEQARADIGSALYTTIFGATAGKFSGLTGNLPRGAGLSQGMGPLVPFNPASGPALHGVDVAAAYLYAVLNDVLDPNNPPPADLPDAFAQVYFPTDLGSFGTIAPAQRQEAIAGAGQGIVRMLYGVLLMLFALFEAATNLIWTLGLGLLLIGLAIALVFGFFAPLEHIVAGLGHQVIEAFMASWGISALQGVLMAAVLAVAASGNAVAVLGVGLLALVLEFVFLVVAFRTIARATLGALGAATGGTLDAGAMAAGAALATASVGQTGATLGGVGAGVGKALAGGSSALGSGLTGLLGTGGAYAMARQSGNTHAYAATYALAQHRPLARVGTLAAAMGLTNADQDRALWSATVIAPGTPLSLRAQRSVERDAATARVEAARAAANSANPTPPGGKQP